jgi:outer membrane protein insertion porin family
MKYKLFSFLLFIIISFSISAQESEEASSIISPENIIKKIEVFGAKRINPNSVVAFSGLSLGQKITEDSLDLALKNLYKTNFFNDIYINDDDSVLKIHVQENPTIKQVAFEGNKDVADSDLSSMLGLSSGDIFVKNKVDKATNIMLQNYRKNGNFNASVEPKVIQLDQNKINLVFEIDEGNEVLVRKIVFQNNKEFKSYELKNIISTKETAWWKFLESADVYDPTRIDYDKELLRQHYLNSGFVDYKLNSVISEMTAEKDGFFITYNLKEGDRYAFGDNTTKSYIALNDAEEDMNEIDKLLESQKGEWYSVSTVESTVKKITNIYEKHGYAFVEVSPKVSHKNEKTKVIGVTYNIKEGKKISVGRLNIFGNVRTKDEVIRRELTFVEGDSYNKEKIGISTRKINNLGYFANLDLRKSVGTAPDKVDIDINVEEKSTGEFNFGVGFSTVDDFITNISVKERNLFGTGRSLEFLTNLSGRKQEYDISYTEPYFLGRNIITGFDLFHITYDNQDERSHDQTDSGFGLRMGYRINDDWKQSWNYNYRITDINNVKETASRFIKEQEGENVISSVSQTLTYSTVDNRMNPHEGSLMKWNIDLAGIGGDENFVRNRLQMKKYFNLGNDFVWAFSTEGGYISQYDGEKVRIGERFYLGGNSLKGFDVAGIGPRDIDTDDALGGNLMYKIGTELATPFPYTKDSPVSLRFFVDAGSVTESDDSGTEIVDSGLLRASYGAGLVWHSPMGPLRFDFAKAFSKEEYDETKSFKFSIGSSF